MGIMPNCKNCGREFQEKQMFPILGKWCVVIGYLCLECFEEESEIENKDSIQSHGEDIDPFTNVLTYTEDF
jgi:hypothetical protein